MPTAVYGGDITDVRLSPLLASSHAGLPPAHIQVMGLDILRDDGVAYEKVLREAGVPTKLIEWVVLQLNIWSPLCSSCYDRYEGTYHAAYYPLPAMKVSLAIERDTRRGLKWLLGRGATTL